MPECHLKNETCGFRCTGFDGGIAWKKRTDAIKKDVTCESCQEHALKIESFVHDHVNAGLGKQVFDKTNYSKIVQEINCVYNTCKEQGRC